MQRSKNSGLMAALAMVAIGGVGIPALAAAPLRSADHKPPPPKRNTAMQREIADHNAEVEARNAAKRDRKRSR